MSASNPILRVFDDPAGVARAAAEEFERRAAHKADSGADFAVALSGGSTPKRLFALLADSHAERIPWERVHLFWGDERPVGPEHPDSNYGAAREALIDRVPIPEDNVHRIVAEGPDPEAAAAAYEATLRRFFGLASGALPRFDLIFLGMGADGHTASLFPGSEALAETQRLVVAPWVKTVGSHRVSLTCPVLNNAACIMFLVTGAEKAETLRRVIKSVDAGTELPARLIRPRDGELVWLVDRAAASRLNG